MDESLYTCTLRQPHASTIIITNIQSVPWNVPNKRNTFKTINSNLSNRYIQPYSILHTQFPTPHPYSKFHSTPEEYPSCQSSSPPKNPSSTGVGTVRNPFFSSISSSNCNILFSVSRSSPRKASILLFSSATEISSLTLLTAEPGGERELR